jgi:hypothetical protein
LPFGTRTCCFSFHLQFVSLSSPPRTTLSNACTWTPVLYSAISSHSFILHFPDVCTHSKTLPDSSFPVSLLLSTFPLPTFPNVIFHSSLSVDYSPTPALAISSHKSDLSPIATSTTVTHTTFSKMPAALSDTQNRYLALAWLCVDVDPKVSTYICVAQINEKCATSRECRIPQRSQQSPTSYLMVNSS